MKNFSLEITTKGLRLLWLGLIVAFSSQAQTITVRDDESGEPLEGVILVSDTPPASTVTNSKGQANISAFEGAEIVRITLLGYQTTLASFDEIASAGLQVRLVRAPMTLDQVVISANRAQQASLDVSSTITTITPADVEFHNPQTAADLLGLTGQVFIQKSQQGGGSPMIRGFAANRLVYAVDGVRMNTAIFRSGNLQNVINVDPFATERTEVLFGPGSVMYGSDAIGGVMSFNTLKPQLSFADTPLFKSTAVTRYSSANKEKTGHVDFNVGWKKWALVTSISSWDYDHLRQGEHGPDEYVKPIYVTRQEDADQVVTQKDPLLQIPSAYSQVNVMQKVAFVPNPDWDLQYGFHYSNTSQYGRYDRHNRYRNGTLRYAEWNYGPQLWLMNNLAVTHQRRTKLYDRMTARFAHQKFEESRIDRSLNSNERNTQTENVNAFSANVDWAKYAGQKHLLFYGLEYVFNDVVSTGRLTDVSSGTGQVGPSRYPQSTWSSLAFYASDEFRPNEQLTLNAGLRYNLFQMRADFNNNLAFYPFPFTTADINNGALTGSVGAVYNPGTDWSIRANLGTAFRAPNVDDVGKIFDSTPGAVLVPNPGLKAEYAYNFDLGVARILGKSFKVELAGYYTKLQNALVRRDFQLNGQDSIMYDGVLSQVQAVQNAAVAHVYGVHAGVELRLAEAVMLSSDLNWQKGEEQLDDGSKSPSRHAAPAFGISRVTYTQNGLTLELNAIYQAERAFDELPMEEREKDEIYAKDRNGNNYSPSWHTVNFKAMYQLTKNIDLNAGVENITDQRYRPYSSGISGAGRNFVVSVRVKVD